MEQLGECHFVDDGKMQDANPYMPKNVVFVPQQAMFTYAETSKLVATAVAFHEGVNAETAHRFQETIQQMMVDHRRECEILHATLKAQEQQSSAPPLHFASEKATALWSADFPTILQEFESPAKALQERRSPKKTRTTRLDMKTPTEALQSVLEGIATVNPLWHATYFEFESPDAASRFWTEVCESPLWHDYSEAKMKSCHGNPARKVLQSLGYTDAQFGKQRTLTKTRKRQGEERESDLMEEGQWQLLVQWKWDMRMALRNCYWFWARSMDVNTKKMLQHAFSNSCALGEVCTQSEDPQDAFSFVNDENIKDLQKATFRFETEAVARPGVLGQIVFLSQKLHEFVQNKQIVNLQYAVARPERHVLHEILQKYSNLPGIWLSAPPAAEAPESAWSFSSRYDQASSVAAAASTAAPAASGTLMLLATTATSDWPSVQAPPPPP